MLRIQKSKMLIGIRGSFRIPILLFCSCAILSARHGLSQPTKFSSAASLAEKIYLQLDNNVYTTDQTIWFKAIVAKAVDHTPTEVSGVLHVELIDPSENISEKKLIKLEKVIGEGFFQLTKNYIPGVYMVRAYTGWNKNFGPPFFFKEYIQLFGTETTSQVNPFAGITLTEGNKNNRELHVRFDPLRVDSLAGKELLVYLTLDGKKDSVSF